MAKLIVAGIGPGTLECVTPEVKSWAEKADLLIGGRRALDLFPAYQGRSIKINKDYAAFYPEIRECLLKDELVVVLVSGDPGLFSLLQPLQKEFKEEIVVLPGISSIQVAASRLQRTWYDAFIFSIHNGLPDKFPQLIKDNEKMFILTGRKYDSLFILEHLLSTRQRDWVLAFCVDLGQRNEEVLEVDLSTLSEEEITELKDKITLFNSRLVVVYLEKNFQEEDTNQRFGISNDEFATGSVPVTKEEIRAIVLSKLQLKPSDIFFDIGSGTGSIAIQGAMLVPRGWVYAIESNPLAVELIKENIERFNLTNITLMEGFAPSIFPKEGADAIFIGGTRGYLPEILSASRERLQPKGRIVLTAVTLDTLLAVTKEMEKLEDWWIETQLVQISTIEEKVGVKFWRGQNPIHIMTIGKRQ